MTLIFDLYHESYVITICMLYYDWQNNKQEMFAKHLCPPPKTYGKRANIRGGFNFAMFTIDDFSAKLKPLRLFNNTSVYIYLWLHVHLKIPNPRN